MADPFLPLTSDADWQEAQKRSNEELVLIFKHSSACSVSGRAHEEMKELAEAGDLPVYRVVVQNHRPISDAIESDLEVRHETPQAILLRDGRPVFDTSHFDVTADTIRQTLQQPSLSSD